MATRLETFEGYKSHPWLKKVYNRMTESERKLATDFIQANDSLDKANFEYAINRMFLDKDRPKNYKFVLELLTCANSAL